MQTVKIRFSNQYAVKNLKDAPFIHCEHSWETEDNGSFVMTAQLLPNRELLTWVLYYGCHAEIVEPEFFVRVGKKLVIRNELNIWMKSNR